jgi:hypothetical protein
MEVFILTPMLVEDEQTTMDAENNASVMLGALRTMQVVVM